MTDQPDDDWLAGERERHGPVTEDDIHQGYDMVLDARQAAKDAELWALDRSLDPPVRVDDIPVNPA